MKEVSLKFWYTHFLLYPLLFYNLDEELWPAIKSFLIFLNRVHENPKTKVHEIEADDYCLQQLKEL